MMLTIGRNNRNTVVEGTSGQNFIIVCLQCLRVKHYHTQECLSGAHNFAAGVNQSAMVTVHVSSMLLIATTNLDCILTDKHAGV